MLAAGGSTRFGSPKQLLVYAGESLIRRAARSALDSGAYPVVVVLGAHAAEVAAAVADLDRLRIVINQDWQTGIASSLCSGVRAIAAESGCDAALVILADQPKVDALSLRKLLSAFDAEHRIVASCYGDTIGVPAIFGREHFDEILSLRGDAGAGRWFRQRKADVTCVPLEAAALDIDTISDV